jgi:dihydroorotate dehydrogenase electron transfer subunit
MSASAGHDVKLEEGGFLKPLGADLPRATTIVSVIQETPRVKTFVLDEGIAADPGQFVMVWLPRLDEKPFSVVQDHPLTLTVANVGPFSSRMHDLQVGDRLWVRGPLGRGFEITGDRMLLVGGGYGVAPLTFLARRTAPATLKVAVVGSAGGDDLFFQDRLAEAGCEVVVSTEDGSCGIKGLCTDVAEALLTERGFDILYGCGPDAMLDKLGAVCKQHGVSGQLSREAYMRCGMGVCGSCQRGGLLVCRDGPVFCV